MRKGVPSLEGGVFFYSLASHTTQTLTKLGWKTNPDGDYENTNGLWEIVSAEAARLVLKGTAPGAPPLNDICLVVVGSAAQDISATVNSAPWFSSAPLALRSSNRSPSLRGGLFLLGLGVEGVGREMSWEVGSEGWELGARDVGVLPVLPVLCCVYVCPSAFCLSVPLEKGDRRTAVQARSAGGAVMRGWSGRLESVPVAHCPGLPPEPPPYAPQSYSAHQCRLADAFPPRAPRPRHARRSGALAPAAQAPAGRLQMAAAVRDRAVHRGLLLPGGTPRRRGGRRLPPASGAAGARRRAHAPPRSGWRPGDPIPQRGRAGPSVRRLRRPARGLPPPAGAPGAAALERGRESDARKHGCYRERRAQRFDLVARRVARALGVAVGAWPWNTRSRGGFLAL